MIIKKYATAIKNDVYFYITGEGEEVCGDLAFMKNGA